MDHRDEAASWAAPTPIAAGASPSSDPVTPPGQSPQSFPPPPAPPAWQPPAGAMPGAGGAAPVLAPTAAAWQPGFMPLRPLGFGDLLGLPFRAMRYNRTVVVGGPLLLTLGATVLTVVALWLLFTDPSLALLDPFSEADAITGTTIGALVAALVAAFLADVFSSAVVAPGVARGVLGERIRLADAFRAIRPRIGALLLLYVIAGLALLLVIALGAVPLVIGIVNESGGAIAAGVIVVLLVALPAGFAFSLIGGLARPVIVLEQRGAIDALKRVVRLVRGRFWWSLLVVFVASSLIGIVSNIVNQVGGFGAALVTLALPESTLALGIAFALVLASTLVISYVLTYSYLGSLFALLVIDLRIRHEGFDLTLAEAAEARHA